MKILSVLETYRVVKVLLLFMTHQCLGEMNETRPNTSLIETTRASTTQVMMVKYHHLINLPSQSNFSIGELRRILHLAVTKTNLDLHMVNHLTKNKIQLTKYFLFFNIF